ncbi:unnamed protein product, partial [Durusdinium trenchii]
MLGDFPRHPVAEKRNRKSCVGCTLYCDEIESLNESWMFVLWSSDVSPYRTDSVSSRFPIAIIPASLYVINDEGVN